MGTTALITGASSGIGKSLAQLHAARGGDVILVARNGKKLEALAAELRKEHRITATVIAADLSDPAAPQALFEQVRTAGLSVDVLINNAGVGGRGKFHQRRLEEDLSMITLNVSSLVALTRLFLPGFVERGSGRILNTSSTAALLPGGPLQAVYCATKAFVTSFGNALAEELRGTGVTVTTLMPGATETEFAKAAGMDKTELFSATADVKDVARAGYEAMLRGDLEAIAGLTFVQRLMLSAAPMTPKKMLLKTVYRMQDVRA